MEPSTPRPTTPPPFLGLLSPPSTGGCGKRTSFARPQEALNSSSRQIKTRNLEGETLTEFFGVNNEGLGVQGDNDRDISCLPLHGSLMASESDCMGEFAKASKTSLASEHTALDQIDTTLDTTFGGISPPTMTQPFRLLSLPPSVRTKVYEYLLVIPALICVRQKHTAFHDERKAFLYTERRELLPGIAYALTQTKVDGPKSRFSRFPGTNLHILRASKQVFAEARATMYSLNDFDIVKPSNELAPPPDFSVRLFPPGYQRLITKLTIRIRTFYDLDWLLNGGYNVVKNHYRGLGALTLILEMDSATKGFGRQWGRKENEKWVLYIQRLKDTLAEHLFGETGAKPQTIPTCLNLRVLFCGESYHGSSGSVVDVSSTAMTGRMGDRCTEREELRSALVEAWELFKKGAK